MVLPRTHSLKDSTTTTRTTRSTRTTIKPDAKSLLPLPSHSTQPLAKTWSRLTTTFEGVKNSIIDLPTTLKKTLKTGKKNDKTVLTKWSIALLVTMMLISLMYITRPTETEFVNYAEKHDVGFYQGAFRGVVFKAYRPKFTNLGILTLVNPPSTSHSHGAYYWSHLGIFKTWIPVPFPRLTAVITKLDAGMMAVWASVKAVGRGKGGVYVFG